MMYRSILAILVATVFCLGYWWYVLVWTGIDSGDSGARVHFLDVGQGDAILIETPGNRQVLVDAGRGIGVLNELRNSMGSQDRDIDVVVMTHPDADHIGGFAAVFDRYDVGVAIESFITTDSSIYSKVRVKMEAEEGLDVYTISSGQSFTLDGMQFDILWPIGEEVRETNSASVVLLVSYGEMKVLLTGDVSSLIEERIIALFPERTKDVDILKAGHHGSKTSTAPSFLEHTKPNAFVYSMKAGNHYGHPHDSVREIFMAYAEKFPAEQAKEYWTSNGTVSFCLTEMSFSEC